METVEYVLVILAVASTLAGVYNLIASLIERALGNSDTWICTLSLLSGLVTATAGISGLIIIYLTYIL